MSALAYHEPVGELDDEIRDMHRAIASLIEELEAVDWYNQRAAVCKDESLRKILIHNRNEEMEHAAMAIEWIRRRSPNFEEKLKEFLFTEEEIAEHG